MRGIQAIEDALPYDDHKRIREDIAMNGDELKTILNSKTFKTTFGQLWGDELKTAPKGFDKEHPHIDLIRKKQFLTLDFINLSVIITKVTIFVIKIKYLH